MHTVRKEGDNMNSKFIDYKALAAAIQTKIVSEFSTDHAEARMTDETVSYQAMLISDAGDMLNVCRYIAYGEINKAQNALWNMDTLPRENLMWYIEEIAGADFFSSMAA